jgi:outer membrane protein assembly factor BamB
MRSVLAGVLLGLMSGPAAAADWATYGGNSARTQQTAEELPGKLALRWTIKRSQPPVPAWPLSNRMTFDRADHPVIAGGSVYIGSSATGKVYALDAATGKERWSIFTGGPVRFAPAVADGRVFVASDDGCLYCLTADSGKILWSKRGGPGPDMVLGNDRMISRWPARGGPVVADGIVYFAAGIWPSEGIYLYALEAATGKVLWLNDSSGGIYMGQPHGGAYAESGVAAQGYLVVTGDKLLVPTGRAVPAAFDRATGKFLYFHLQANTHRGGSATIAAGPQFVNAGYTYETATGEMSESVGDGAVAASPDRLFRSTAKELIEYRWVDREKIDRKGQKIRFRGLEKGRPVPVAGGTSLVVAGKQAIVGGAGAVHIVDLALGKVTWSAEVDGTPYGLAVADGRLLVSTDRGTLHCFAAPAAEPPITHEVKLETRPYGDNEAAAAAAIMRQGKTTDGYCADLGCGDGALAFELARATKLHIVAIDPDPAKVEAARRRLDAAGLYGNRVTVHLGDPARSPLPPYFANLVVSNRALAGGTDAEVAREAGRLQRPYGGVACLGKPDDLKVSSRGPLEGAGNWTHQYADPANTSCSADDLVKGPLGVLWYRDSDFAMPSRHGRGPAPVVYEGRLIVEGINGLRAMDAYNGRELWQFSIPGVLKPYDGEHLVGVAATGSNLCISEAGVYVRAGGKCYRLDPATGRKLAEFDAPSRPDGKPGTWGYLAVAGGTVFGSVVDTEHLVKYAYRNADMSQLFTESLTLFAVDAETGSRKWTYTAKHAIRHNAIAAGDGRIYLIDRPLATMDRPDGKKGDPHPPGELVALDAMTGEVVWRVPNVYGTTLSLSVEHKTLLMSYQSTRFKLPSEVGGRLAAFATADGKQLWDNKARYVTRPLINDRTVYAQGGAWDLLTGAERPFPFKRSYGCGQLAGSSRLMLFRSATLGYYDLVEQKGTTDYGGIRPGCWINAIPAGGVVLVPDGTASCKCSYLNQAWIALYPLESLPKK